MAHLAEPLMRDGGTLFTMTYYGSQVVVANYNVMGVAKAALESAVRYLAAELGPKGIRVHAISPGPLATRAASGIPEFDALLEKAKAKAPAHRLVSVDDVGVAVRALDHFDAAADALGQLRGIAYDHACRSARLQQVGQDPMSDIPVGSSDDDHDGSPSRGWREPRSRPAQT